MMPGRTYLHIVVISVLCAVICYIAKLIHYDAEDIIIRAPDVTLYDIIYFNSENFVNLFSFITITSLCYFNAVTYPYSISISHIKYLTLYITTVLFIRALFHLFTYDKPYTYEYIIYMCILLLFIIRAILYNFKHYREQWLKKQ